MADSDDAFAGGSKRQESILPTSGDAVSQIGTEEGASLHGRRVVAGRYEILSKLGKGGMGEV